MSKKILSEDSRERLVAAYEKTKDITSVALMFGIAESNILQTRRPKKKNRFFSSSNRANAAGNTEMENKDKRKITLCHKESSFICYTDGLSGLVFSLPSYSYYFMKLL